MKSSRHFLLPFLVLLVLLPAAAQKKSKNGYGNFYRNPNQKAEIAGAATALGTAHRKCENYAWAAIVETMMRAQEVKLLQDDLASNTSSGMKCYSTLSDYPERAAAITNDYVLDGGRKAHIDAEYTVGALAQPATLVNSVRLGRPLMIILNGRPYMLYSVLYDELIHTTGAMGRQYVLRELKLLDAALPASRPERIVTFAMTPETLDQITGVMSITVTPR